MTSHRVWIAVNMTALALAALGLAGCLIGAIVDPAAFFRAWLCSFVFWLGVPLAGVTLVLVHDLSGGNWMATARPVLDAAIATMPIASLSGIAAFVGLGSLYSWAEPSPNLTNAFYLNPTDFFIRYAVYLALWNLLAAFALFGPRRGGMPVSSALSWLSGLGLVVLALSASFAAIDWILSLEPAFWSSAFPYIEASGWFNTGMAAIVLCVSVIGWPSPQRREHMSDLARILLATIIFWGYIEFVQFLIIWEENLKTEIPWYLKRLHSVWKPAIDVSTGLGFVIPFWLLLWGPSKRNRAVVAAACGCILLGRIADAWLLVLPEFKTSSPLWLDFAAMAALGGAMVLMFAWSLRYVDRLAAEGTGMWAVKHG